MHLNSGPGIGITIEQCARTWSGVEHQHKAWESVAPGQHPPSLFLSFYFLGWVPPTSTNHRLQAQRVGPAHTLFSAAEYYIGIYRICQEKNFIYFELLALHLVP